MGRTMRGVSIVLASTMLLSAAVLVGCQQVAEQAAKTAIEKSTGVKVNKDANGVSVETSKGSVSASTDNKLPTDFPSDIPVYQPSTVKAAVTNDSNGKTGYLVNLDTSDAKTDVFAWYKKQLAANDWKIENTVEVTSGAGGFTAKKDTTSLFVAIADGQNGATTNITITTTPGTK